MKENAAEAKIDAMLDETVDKMRDQRLEALDLLETLVKKSHLSEFDAVLYFARMTAMQVLQAAEYCRAMGRLDYDATIRFLKTEGRNITAYDKVRGTNVDSR